jgi:hypothetical protein
MWETNCLESYVVGDINHWYDDGTDKLETYITAGTMMGRFNVEVGMMHAGITPSDTNYGFHKCIS